MKGFVNKYPLVLSCWTLGIYLSSFLILTQLLLSSKKDVISVKIYITFKKLIEYSRLRQGREDSYRLYLICLFSCRSLKTLLSNLNIVCLFNERKAFF